MTAASEIPPLVRSPELAGMEDLAEKLQAAEILADHGRDPRLSEFAIRAKGDDIPAKVRAFEKLFDTTVAEVAEKRFARGQPSQKISGSVSGKEFLSLAKQAQDESIPATERDSLVAEMMTALKQGRVR